MFLESSLMMILDLFPIIADRITSPVAGARGRNVLAAVTGQECLDALLPFSSIDSQGRNVLRGQQCLGSFNFKRAWPACAYLKLSFTSICTFCYRAASETDFDYPTTYLSAPMPNSLHCRQGAENTAYSPCGRRLWCFVWSGYFSFVKMLPSSKSERKPILNQRHCSFGVYLAQDRMALKAELGSSSSLPLRRKAGGTEVEKHVAGASFAPYFGSLFRFNPTWPWLSLENEDCPICLAEDGRTYFSGSNRSGPNGKPLCRIGIAEVRSD